MEGMKHLKTEQQVVRHKSQPHGPMLPPQQPFQEKEASQISFPQQENFIISYQILVPLNHIQQELLQHPQQFLRYQW